MPDACECAEIYAPNGCTPGYCQRTVGRETAEYAGADGGTAVFVDLGPYENRTDVATAYDEATFTASRGHLFTSYPPPRNAPLSWNGQAIGHPDGHKALSRGDGTAWTTDLPTGTITVKTIDQITQATGYAYMGWGDELGGMPVPNLGVVSTTTTPPGGVGANVTTRPTTDVQQFLADHGYDIGPSGVDGVWGPATTAGFTAWQRDAGLVADGVYGPMSDQAMFPPAFTHVDDRIDEDGIEGRQTTAKEQAALGVTIDAARGSETIAAEQRLTGATPDGADGPDTATHLQQYLTALGYPVAVDGDRGPETVTALQRALNDGRFGQPIPAAPLEDAPQPAPSPDPVDPSTPTPAPPAADPEPGAPAPEPAPEPEPGESGDAGGPGNQEPPVPDPIPVPINPEEPSVTIPPITKGEADAIGTSVAAALAKIPEPSLPDGALGSVVTDASQRARIYSVTMLIGIVLKMVGAGTTAALAAGFAIWATLTLGIAEQAKTALAPWVPLAVVAVAVFAFVSGAYAVWAQQTVALARANTTKS